MSPVNGDGHEQSNYLFEIKTKQEITKQLRPSPMNANILEKKTNDSNPTSKLMQFHYTTSRRTSNK